MKYEINWSVLWQESPYGELYYQLLLNGLGWTIFIALFAWILAFALGSFIGVMRTTDSKFWQIFGQGYVEVFRNIPLLVQIFLWYFVIPEFFWGSASTWLKQLSPVYTSIICLGFFTSARIAEQVKAGIEALPRGQRMASLALGLTSRQSYRYVLLPTAYRIMLPPLTSEFLSLVKNTSVCFTIGVMELMGQTNSMSEFTFKTFEALTAATTLYLLINLVVVLIARFLERKTSIPGFMTSH
ncbi:amino acid ABC transporter permease [Microvirga sp. W0021]|uniref:Amino acid ABC transporter permease n=1 Tax=Hohaiivirga grylli TaxID=3133970 RepID=A0ABV0BJC0_9HYPH